MQALLIDRVERHNEATCCVQVPSHEYSQDVAQGLRTLLKTRSDRGVDVMAALNHMALNEGASTGCSGLGGGNAATSEVQCSWKS